MVQTLEYSQTFIFIHTTNTKFQINKSRRDLLYSIYFHIITEFNPRKPSTAPINKQATPPKNKMTKYIKHTLHVYIWQWKGFL